MENNTNKKNYYRKTNRFYNKSKIISYTKKFETFEEGFSEVIKYNPELKNYCGRDPILLDVVSSMLNSIKDNIPSIDNYNYPNTLSLSINAKEVGFKTDINIALGWRTGYDFNSGKSYYIFRVSFMTIPSYKKSIISDMTENGWNKINKEIVNKLDKKKENKQKIVTIPKEDQKYVKLDQGLDVDLDESEYETEEDSISSDDNKKDDNNSNKQLNDNDSSKNKEEINEEKLNKEDEEKISSQPNLSTDSVVASPVAGTFIITHNNQTSVININEPNKNGLIIDKENMIVTYPDGAKFNLTK